MASNVIVLHPPPCRKALLGELKEEGGTFYLRGKRITYIDIIGTVISILNKAKRTVLEVDDNTAIIRCVTFDSDDEEVSCETNSEDSEDAAVPDGLPRRLWEQDKPETPSEFFMRLAGRRRPIKLGDLVNVTGRLNVFYDRWQIITCSVVRVKDCNAEWFRIREIEAQRKALKER
ncbi:uncharacterized protein LOC126983615 [Eriocheir sinensis]|uniref:uncharacterized protein LOC126983615 n=1 Tax=Eriocheir sinensis TaxID=95602 RepID=UPI0021C597C4|nr:uncharacterized protein LOC126983615 [Eriocheir sinensis]XP_050692406.1 uncharacterized protein LOC126983615 [Eriocheir sinensis]